MALHTSSRSADTTTEFDEDVSPSHQLVLRSLMSITSTLEFDTSFYFVDEMPRLNIPSTNNLDMRLGWKPLKGLQLELIGRNLIDRWHEEFGDDLYERKGFFVRRGVYRRLTVEF